MELNHEGTRQILDALADVCDLRSVTVSRENKDWLGRWSHSDFVSIEKAHKIGFEVFDNEIIVFYFDDHCHFEDYTSELPEGQPPYVQRAIEFLRQLFTRPLLNLVTMKGSKIIRREWFLILPDGRRESLSGYLIDKLFTNPFAKRKLLQTTWYYRKDHNAFEQRPAPEGLSTVIEYDWDIHIEILQRNSVYTYLIMQNLYDEYSGDLYWTPVSPGGSYFDTEENAIQAAKDEAKTYRNCVGGNPETMSLFNLWRTHITAPYQFPMNERIWEKSMYDDTDSDGRKLFYDLITNRAGTGLIQYGRTAFGFDQAGEISDSVHYNVIRALCFAPDHPDDGNRLLQEALTHFGADKRVYAFFHYFGMSACGRHGKLHESSPHVEKLLLENGFMVEHENVYYSRTLTDEDAPPEGVTLRWGQRSAGDCREFCAAVNNQEVGWGQVHFLPQKDIAYLRWIFIDEKRQHQGLGTAIMGGLFTELRQMGIRRFDTDTALSNTVAQGYYEKTGFTNRGITRSYYTK